MASPFTPNARAGPITIVRATYGVPCQPGCASCGNVPLGNLDIDAKNECDGKQKCVVSSCPCTAGNVPPRRARHATSTGRILQSPV
jgi:hypothetical protein